MEYICATLLIFVMLWNKNDDGNSDCDEPHWLKLFSQLDQESYSPPVVLEPYSIFVAFVFLSSSVSDSYPLLKKWNIFLQLTSFESLLSFLETFFLFLVLVMTTWIDWNKSFLVGPIGKVHSVTTTSNITLAWKQDQLLERETSLQLWPTTMWMRTSSQPTSTASSSCFPFHPSWCLSATAEGD